MMLHIVKKASKVVLITGTLFATPIAGAFDLGAVTAGALIGSFTDNYLKYTLQPYTYYAPEYMVEYHPPVIRETPMIYYQPVVYSIPTSPAYYDQATPVMSVGY